MEPSGQPEGSKASASAVSSSAGVRPSRPPASRDFRTVHSASTRGGGPRPSESIRRAAVTPDDLREGYLVWDVTYSAELLLSTHKHRCRGMVRTMKPLKEELINRTVASCTPKHAHYCTMNTTQLHTVKPALNALKIHSVWGLHKRRWFKDVPKYFYESCLLLWQVSKLYLILCVSRGRPLYLPMIWSTLLIFKSSL